MATETKILKDLCDFTTGVLFAVKTIDAILNEKEEELEKIETKNLKDLCEYVTGVLFSAKTLAEIFNEKIDEEKFKKLEKIRDKTKEIILKKNAEEENTEAD